jgi:hypothetical protein
MAMEDTWQQGQLPRVEDWFRRIQQRKTFQSAIRDWVPQALQQEMRANGQRSWPQIQQLLAA